MMAHPTSPGKVIHPQVAAIRAKAEADRARRAAVDAEIEQRRAREAARVKDSFFARVQEQFEALASTSGNVVPSQEAMLDLQLNARKHMGKELTAAKEAFENRDKTTVAVGPSFKYTEQRAALRPAKEATESFSISTQDMKDYQRNLRVVTSRVRPLMRAVASHWSQVREPQRGRYTRVLFGGGV